MSTPTLESFLKDVSSHQLTVNLDQGVFRDITIKKPNSVNMHYNITTRPGFLIFTGDMGEYVFERTNDMFGFFRSQDNAYYINTGYWGEKVKAGAVSKFDPETACDSVKQYLTNFLDDLDLSDSEDQKKSKQALEAVNDFISGNQNSGEFDFWEDINSWDADEAGGLELDDFWEAPTTAKTHHYIWACYAIVHAIKLYDEFKAQEPTHD
jgi:hypothetical protein